MANERPFLYIIVPLFNEAANLESLLDSFHQLKREFDKGYRVQFIVVDDGSTDGTAIRAQQSGRDLDLVLLKHDVNRGPGRAFATAFEYLHHRLQDSDWTITMEGDNTSRDQLVGQMLTRTREGYEVILASPYAYGGGILNTSLVRFFLSHVANSFVKGILGIRGISTMSSFFRLYRGSALRRLQAEYGPKVLQRPGFESMIEMLLKMIYLKMKISEVPMLLDTRRRVGKSKMKVLRTILGYFALWWQKRYWRPKSASNLDG